MSDRPKESHARFVVMAFLVTTFVLHIAYRTLWWRSILFAVVGMFAVSLIIGATFYLLDVIVGKAFARFATPGATTDAIATNLGCLLSIVELGATIALTTYAFRELVV